MFLKYVKFNFLYHSIRSITDLEIHQAKFRNKLYVAKKYFRLSDARTRQKISTEDNSKALKSELMRYGIAAHYLKLFFEVAADALIEVDKRASNFFLTQDLGLYC